MLVERCSAKLRAAGRAMDRAGLPSLRSGCAGLRVSSFGKWGPCGRVDLGCRTLFESPHTAGLHSLRSGCADVQKSSSGFLGGYYCRDARHFVVRSNPCSPKAIKGFRPALNAITPALDESWGDGGQGGIRTRGDIAASHAFQACAFDHSATCPKVSHGMRAETSQQYH